MYKKALLVVCLGTFTLSGCSTTVWQKHGATESQFYVQSAQCQGLANNAIQEVRVPTPNPTYYHSGTVSTRSGTASYSGTSTPASDYGVLGAQITNLGVSLQRRKIHRACMTEKGWTLVEKSSVNQDNSNPVSSAAAARWRSIILPVNMSAAVDLSSFRGVTPYSARLVFDNQLWEKPAFKGDVMSELPAGSTVKVERESENWLFVKIKNGKQGYIGRDWIER